LFSPFINPDVRRFDVANLAIIIDIANPKTAHSENGKINSISKKTIKNGKTVVNCKSAIYNGFAVFHYN
jgi:hypothetical protein